MAAAGLSGCGFDGCEVGFQPTELHIQGPFVQNPDGSYSEVSSVEAGQEVSFLVDGDTAGQSKKCPEVINWYLSGGGEGVGPNATKKPVNTQQTDQNTCVIRNERVTWWFPAASTPGPHTVEITAEALAPLPDGPSKSSEDTVIDAVGASMQSGVGKKLVTVVTPDGQGGGSTTPGGGSTNPPGGTTTPGTATVAFKAADSYGAGDRALGVDTGDFIGADGANDVVTVDDKAAADDEVLVYPNNGDGTLNAHIPPLNLGTGAEPQDVVAGDWNRDGTDDLAIAEEGNNDLAIFENTGGSFDPGIGGGAASQFVGQSPVAVDAGDLNTDTGPKQYPDLVAANSGGDSVSVLINFGNIGAGGFLAADDHPSGGTLPNDVAVGDVDGDGRDDIVVANAGSEDVQVLRNTGPKAGSGSLSADFAPPQRATGGAGRIPHAVVVGDLNGDGREDIVVANAGDGTVSVLLTTSGASSTLTFAETTLQAGHGPVDVAIGDFNGDGKPDIASANQGSDNASVYANNGSGTFSGPESVAMGDGPTAVAAGALNAGSLDDLAVANFGDPGAVPPSTGASVTVALAQTPHARSALRAPGGLTAKGKKIKATGSFSNDHLLSFGESSFDANGVGHMKGVLVTADLKAKAKGKLPGRLGKALKARVIGRLDVDLYPEADLTPPTVLSGTVAGVSKKDPKTAICLNMSLDSRAGQEAANWFKVIGATGGAAGVKAGGAIDPATLTQPQKQTTLAFAAKTGKKRKLSATCKSLLKKLPK
jgi:hypothetical protein